MSSASSFRYTRLINLKKRSLTVKKSDVELDGFKNYLFEKGKREKTIEDYIRHIKNFHKWLQSEGSDLEQLTRYDIQQYIKHLQDRGNKARYQLRRYLKIREDDNPALFLSNFKKRISVRAVQRIFEKLGFHPHMLRHTYGRELVSSGVDIATVAELMGHSDVNVTRRYAAPSMKDLEQAVEKVFG